MSEWLTTGEMIDRLHVGQTAEGFIETERGPIKRIEVTKNDAHSIMVIDSWTVFEASGIIYLTNGESFLNKSDLKKR